MYSMSIRTMNIAKIAICVFQIEEELANYGLAANQIRWLSNNALSLEEGRHRFKVQAI